MNLLIRITNSTMARFERDYSNSERKKSSFSSYSTKLGVVIDPKFLSGHFMTPTYPHELHHEGAVQVEYFWFHSRSNPDGFVGQIFDIFKQFVVIFNKVATEVQCGNHRLLANYRRTPRGNM